ncbi:MAG: T9SS type A sorting domain-containing protein, partial [Bacteroidia bacterium]
KFIVAFELQSCEEVLYDTTIIFMWKNPTIVVKDSFYCGSVNDNISFSCFACKILWSNNSDAHNFVVNQPGKYWVRAENYCNTISDTFTLSYLPFLKLQLGNDTLLCNKETLTLKNTLKPGKYLWNDGDTSSTKTISKTGKYFLDFENKCNKLNDTIVLNYKKSPGLNLGSDSIYCAKISHSISLDSIIGKSNIKWWDGSTLSNKIFNTSGKYYATISNECGIASDTIQLGILNIPKVDLGKDTIYCHNFEHVVSIYPKVSDYKIEWGDGKDSLNRKFTNSGLYSVKVYNKCGETKDTLTIIQKTIPIVDLGKDTSLKKPFSIKLDARNAGSEYKWSIGATSPTITVNDFGKYWVTVSNYCGLDADTIWIRDKAGINHLFNKTINVYPNPLVDGNLFIENLNGDFELQLFDQFGNMILKKSSAINQQTININNFSPGIYYLKIEGNGRAEVFRVFKI